MKKEVKAGLILKLTDRMQEAEKQAKIQNRKDNCPQLIVGGDQMRVNRKYISNEQYFQIVELHKFLMENENLTHEEFEKVLRSKFVKFAFLRKLNKMIVHLDDELRLHGVQYVATRYAHKRYDKDVFKYWITAK